MIGVPVGNRQIAPLNESLWEQYKEPIQCSVIVTVICTISYAILYSVPISTTALLVGVSLLALPCSAKIMECYTQCAEAAPKQLVTKKQAEAQPMPDVTQSQRAGLACTPPMTEKEEEAELDQLLGAATAARFELYSMKHPLLQRKDEPVPALDKDMAEKRLASAKYAIFDLIPVRLDPSQVPRFTVDHSQPQKPSMLGRRNCTNHVTFCGVAENPKT